MNFLSYLLVLGGGFLGGVGRFFVSGLIGRRIGQTFPWGTLAVNVTGALLIGAFAAVSRETSGLLGSEWLRDFIVAGVFGGYTTVSSFSLQTLNLALDGEGVQAAFNVAASASFCVGAAGAGYWLAQWIAG